MFSKRMLLISCFLVLAFCKSLIAGCMFLTDELSDRRQRHSGGGGGGDGGGKGGGGDTAAGLPPSYTQLGCHCVRDEKNAIIYTGKHCCLTALDGICCQKKLPNYLVKDPIDEMLGAAIQDQERKRLRNLRRKSPQQSKRHKHNTWPKKIHLGYS